MSRAHSNKGRYFVFGNREEMNRFILLYRDLFTPYGEDRIRCRSYVQDVPTYKTKNGNLMSKGHHDDNIVKMLEQGYDITSDRSLIANLTPDSMNAILEGGCFKKESFGRNRSRYVYVGEPA